MFVIINLKRYRLLYILLATLLIVGMIIGFPKVILKFLYPLKYNEYVFKYSDIYNIDPYLVMSVMKVESNFDVGACSPKNAKGLMQLTEQTANWGAKEIGLNDFDKEKIYDPETNIHISCWYIAKLKSQFNEDLNLLLAAYNAGSGNVTKWLNNKEYSKSGNRLDFIPFKETRLYVRKVNKEYNIYKEIYTR